MVLDILEKGIREFILILGLPMPVLFLSIIVFVFLCSGFRFFYSCLDCRSPLESVCYSYLTKYASCHGLFLVAFHSFLSGQYVFFLRYCVLFILMNIEVRWF